MGAIQFVNILDSAMVMPPTDFASALDIPTSHIGVVGGSYTLAAALAGLVGLPFLDRFDRRLALGVSMLGLVVGTALVASRPACRCSPASSRAASAAWPRRCRSPSSPTPSRPSDAARPWGR